MRTHLEYVRPAARDNEFVDAPEAIGLHMLLTEALESVGRSRRRAGLVPGRGGSHRTAGRVRRRYGRAAHGQRRSPSRAGSAATTPDTLRVDDDGQWA